MRYLALVLGSALAFTSVAEEAVVLNKGDQAPFTGILITGDQAKGFKKTKIELDYQILLNTSQTRQIALHMENQVIWEGRYQEYKKSSQRLSQELTDLKGRSFWQKAGFFALGCVVTTGLAFAVNKAVNN